MKHEMDRMFQETIQDIEKVPKEFLREYETASGGRARETGPLVYGYSYTLGAIEIHTVRRIWEYSSITMVTWKRTRRDKIRIRCINAYS